MHGRKVNSAEPHSVDHAAVKARNAKWNGPGRGEISLSSGRILHPDNFTKPVQTVRIPEFAAKHLVDPAALYGQCGSDTRTARRGVMEFADSYSELTATVDDISTLEHLEAFVRKVVGTYELKHAVYYMPGVSGQNEIKPVAVITYPPEWVKRYYEADYLGIDPVVVEGFANLLPLDWGTLNKRPPRVRQLFGESVDFGIGRQGMTFPIRGPKGDSALFSVTSDLSDPEWAAAKKTYIRDLQILAHTIHAKALMIGGGKATDYAARLTPRERECLTWCAVGKTSEDIGTILGISEGVVRIHLQSAQHKLDCLNRTHTVAKAITLKLIFPDIR